MKPRETTKINDKKLLLAIRGLEEWRHILEGTMHTIEILNNHQNLTYSQILRTLTIGRNTGPLPIMIQLLPRPQARVALHQVRCTLIVGGPTGHKEDNQDQVMLSAKWFHLILEPSKSLRANRDSPSHVTIKGEESDSSTKSMIA